MSDEPTIDPAFVEQSECYNNLSPDYFASQAIARRYMAHFEAEHFKPLVDKLADEFRDKLWGDIDGWLLGDTESNLGGEIERRVSNTVRALLGGEQWALKAYALGSHYDCGKIRSAVAAYIPKELQDARLADLEAENKKLKEELEWRRKWRGE